MVPGIIAGITWALETIVLGIALAMSPFCSTEQAMFLAPFVSMFLHDACSAIWATIYNGARGQLKNVWKAFCTRSGKWVCAAAVIGGPVGMTGYVLCVNYMGASVGAVASAVFPAVGSVLAFFFLKEKMKWHQWLFLAATLLGVYGLSYSPDLQVSNFLLGLAGALMCSFGWGVEAVILAKCLHDPEVTDEYALQIRQTTSAVTYGLVILPVLKGWDFTASLFSSTSGWVLPTIAMAGLCATVSYLFYYKAISQIGASKAMALNVTYTAWAIVLTATMAVLGLAGATVPSWTTILCTVVVLVCSVFAAADFNEILSLRKTK